MAAHPYRVLFLCTGNSARSILAECLLNRVGAGRFRAFSAGSHPMGRVHPMALELLRERGCDTSGLRSKSWQEFTGADAPPLDLVVTVCDRAAGEACPLLPGRPITAHWGVDDPAAFAGPPAEQRRVFLRAYGELARRIERFASLHIEALDRIALQERLDEIGKGGRLGG
jgi:arsenate reductase